MGRNSPEKILIAYLENILWHTEDIAGTKGKYTCTTELINQYYKTNERHKTKHVHCKIIYENILANVEVTRELKSRSETMQVDLDKSKTDSEELKEVIKKCQVSKDYYKSKCKMIVEEKYRLDKECGDLKFKLQRLDKQNQENSGRCTQTLENQQEIIETLWCNSQKVSQNIVDCRQNVDDVKAKVLKLNSDQNTRIHKLRRRRDTATLNKDDNEDNDRQSAEQIEISNIREDYENVVLEKNELRLENKKLESRLVALDGRFRNEERERSNLQQEIEDCEREVELWQKRFKDLTKEYNDLSGKRKEERQNYALRIKTAKDNEKIIEDLKENFKTKQEEIDNLKATCAQIKRENDEFGKLCVKNKLTNLHGQQQNGQIDDVLEETVNFDVTFHGPKEAIEIHYLGDIESVFRSFERLQILWEKDDFLQGDIKKKMLRKYGRNLQDLVKTNKILTKTKKERQEEFRKKLDDIKEDIRRLEDEWEVKSLGKAVIALEEIIAFKQKFEENLSRIVQDAQMSIETVSACFVVRSRMNDKYKELVCAFINENERLRLMSNEKSVEDRQEEQSLQTTDLHSIKSEDNGVNHENNGIYSENNELLNRKDQALETMAVETKEVIEADEASPNVTHNSSKFVQIRKNVEALERLVDNFSGQKDSDSYSDLHRRLLDSVLKSDLIEEDGREDVRIEKIKIIKQVTKCIRTLEKNACV